MSSTVYVGIDPGKSGGICFLVPIKGSTLYAAMTYKCPNTLMDMAQLLTYPPIENLPPKFTLVCLLERVHSMPMQGVKSVWTFAENYGTWLGILATIPLAYDLIIPNKWMMYYGPKPKAKKDRKHHLKAIAQRLYPEAYITLATADAILIAHYLMNNHNRSK